MYIAVDVQRMCVVAKHADPRAVANLAFIENPYRVVNIHPYANLAAYGIGQLFQLWRNTVGQDFPAGHNIVQACKALASHLPSCPATPAELDQQGAWLEAGAEPYKPHQWQPGKRQPKLMPDGWLPDALTLSLGTAQIGEILAGNILHEPAQAAYSARLEHAVPDDPDNLLGDEDMAMTEEQKAAKALERAAAKKVKDDAKAAAKAKKASDRAAAKAAKLAAKPAKVEQPKQNDVTRPKEGTACANLWNIFDSLSQASGSPTAIGPALEQARAKGFNDSTTRTQYARWRKYNGVSGRIVAAA